jgi:hypothetical protein
MTDFEERGSDSAASEPPPEDTLRLLEAFFRIADPAKQAAVAALAKRYAVSSPKFARALAKLMTKN